MIVLRSSRDSCAYVLAVGIRPNASAVFKSVRRCRNIDSGVISEGLIVGGRFINIVLSFRVRPLMGGNVATLKPKWLVSVACVDVRNALAQHLTQTLL